MTNAAPTHRQTVDCVTVTTSSMLSPASAGQGHDRDAVVPRHCVAGGLKLCDDLLRGARLHRIYDGRLEGDLPTRWGLTDQANGIGAR